MDVKRSGDTVNVSLNPNIPAFTVFFELDARPRIFANITPGSDELERILLGLSAEWRELLLPALESWIGELSWNQDG